MMYKYLHNKEIHTAPGFEEARAQSGFVLPEKTNPISYFIIRIWHWDEEEKDYSIEDFDSPGHEVFDGYDDALNRFNILKTDHLSEDDDGIKLELVQYHRGKLTTYYSKILFPSPLARQL